MIFFISKLYIFIECSPKVSKIFSCNLYLCVHHAYFYAVKLQYCRDWKIWWNLFTCFWCRWIFTIFLHLFIFSIKYSRSASIVNVLSDLWYWLNSNILVSSVFGFWFRRNEANSSNKNPHHILTLVLLIKPIYFLL